MKRYIASIFILSLFLHNTLYAQANLKAKIMVPYPYAIVRGDVPVYGYAYGQDFQEWLLEYGAGEDPKEWILIAKSEKPQSEENCKVNVNFSLNKTIPGNLAMWDTGLTEYEYGEHKVNLPVGVYILRLTATDKQNAKTEDRVRVEVGRVILNSIGGRVESPDGKAIFAVPEHALYDAVEILSFKPIKAKAVSIPQEYSLVSSIYELNPPGLKFTQKATLNIQYERNKIHNKRQIGVYVLNTETKKWEQLESFWNAKEKNIEAYIQNTPAKFTLFCLLEGKEVSNKPKPRKKRIRVKSKGTVLCFNDFEKDFGQWQAKYREVGANLELVGEEAYGHCLKLTKLSTVGNFGCNVITQSFDARKYPLVSFDYIIPPGVKTNFLVKIDNKWYEIVFTDEEKTYWDINMEEIGKISGIQTDNQWHHAEFNLFEMLKEHTNDFIIQEIEMVDWDSTGFMKLEFGQNPMGASLYIDNFIIFRRE